MTTSTPSPTITPSTAKASTKASTTRLRRAGLALALTGAALGLVACAGTTTASGPASASTAAASATTPPTSSPATSGTSSSTADVDGTAFCDAFRSLSDRKQQQDAVGQERYTDEASWDAGVANVERIAAMAPAEIKPQADAYVEMVKARKELAATWNYEPVPEQAKLEFGRAHAALQQQSNQLIAFAKTECSGVL